MTSPWKEQITDLVQEAERHLKIGKPKNMRIALILTDQATEQVLYSAIFLSEFRVDIWHERRELERYFRKKVKFLRFELGSIGLTAEEIQFIIWCHEQRNILYHRPEVNTTPDKDIEKYFHLTLRLAECLLDITFTPGIHREKKIMASPSEVSRFSSLFEELLGELNEITYISPKGEVIDYFNPGDIDLINKMGEIYNEIQTTSPKSPSKTSITEDMIRAVKNLIKVARDVTVIAYYEREEAEERIAIEEEEKKRFYEEEYYRKYYEQEYQK